MPSAGEDLLIGITRRTLNELMVDNGIKIHYGKIDRSMVYTSDEVILTGTLNCALFAHAVDGRVICPKDTPGPVFSWLQEEYFKIIRGEHPKSKEWVTSIPL
jgi:branched-chain amino acid aminotransferase